jgi:hypothetical protein
MLVDLDPQMDSWQSFGSKSFYRLKEIWMLSLLAMDYIHNFETLQTFGSFKNTFNQV